MKTPSSPLKILTSIVVFGGIAIALITENVQAATIYAIETGNWNNTAIWSTGTIPGASDDVIITDPNTVTISDSRSANSVTIENSDDGFLSILSIASGGTLSVTGNVTVTSNLEAAIARLDVTGTITIGGNIIYNSVVASDARIRMLNGGALTLSGIITNITSGNISSAAGSVSTFTFAGSASQTIPMGTGYSYHNLTINKSGSNAATINAAITSSKVRENLTVVAGRFGNGGFAIAGTSGKSFTIQNGGSFILAGTSSFPTTFTLDFQTGSTIIYEGTNTIVDPTGTSFKNVAIQNAGTKSLGGNITINGNLTLSGGTLDVTTTPYNIDIKGNWNNTGGTFIARTGTVTFSGTAAQSIGANSQDFYAVTFNNATTGLSAITLSSDVTITNLCTMTDGIISTGSNKLILTSTNAGNLTGHSSACYVNGNLRRYITNNTSTYALPVGSNAYQLAEIKNNNMTTTTYFDAKFGALQNHRDDEMNVCDGALCYQSLSNVGMWTIDANANPGSGSYDIYAYITNMTGMVDNEFAVVKRPTNSSSGADWIAESAGSINPVDGLGRLVAHGYALRKGLTVFSEFGMARVQTGSSLPIHLVEFKAEKSASGRVNLKWTTATEINNEFFTIERSNNGVNFETLETIQGAGNSSVMLNYKTIDPNPMKGINYYRLKQTDFDGKYTYSNIVSITNNPNTALPAVFNVYPNPVAKGSSLHIYAERAYSENNYQIEIYNGLSGEKIYLQQSNAESGSIDINNRFSPGIYFIKIHDNGTVYHQKILVQ